MLLDLEIRAYESRQRELEQAHRGQFVVFHGEELIGVYGALEDAAEEACRRFGRGPYLIRQVGALGVRLPACVTCVSVQPSAGR
jgi:hypothetical protein